MNPINTALCSFGMSGWVFHAPFIHVHPGFNLYAVMERTKNLSQEKYPDTKVFRTMESMVNDPAVELVVVNTPNYTHYEYAKMALNAGKHVIVEKPFTVSSKEGEELIEVAKRENKKIIVYHNRRYDSDYKAIKKVLADKSLGEIVEAEIHFDRYKVDLSPKVHKETPGPGTGALYDLGSHLIDQALQLFGWPQALFADIRIIRPSSQVDDYFELIFYYPNHRVRLKSSYLVREALPGYQLHGTKGSFIKPRTDVQETLLQSGKTPGTEDWGIEPETERGLIHAERDGKFVKEYVPSFRGNYLDFYEDVFQCIRNNKTNPVPPEDGLNVVRIIEAARKSSENRRAVDL